MMRKTLAEFLAKDMLPEVRMKDEAARAEWPAWRRRGTSW